MSIRACVWVCVLGRRMKYTLSDFCRPFLTLKAYMARSPGGVRSINVFLIATVTRKTEEMGSNRSPSELWLDDVQVKRR